MKIAPLLLLLALPLQAASHKKKTCRVVGVSDGDTLTVRCSRNEREKIRLSDVDAPEKKQAFGQAAKKLASELAFGKDVVIVEHNHDRYGRTVAQVVLPDGKDLGRELVRAGMAWWYKRYSKDPSYGDLEDEARKSRRGLWAEPAPVQPWEFRRKPKTVS